MIAKSGNETYVIYLYADGLMQWTSGSDGTNGFGGYSATVGFITKNGPCFSTKADYNDFIDLPGSDTCSIIYINSRSNVGVPGMFVFALDGTEPVFGNHQCK